MLSVKELPLDDRPREKLVLRGSQNLSDAELLAILLRTGLRGRSVIDLAQSLLLKYGNLARMACISIDALCRDKGIKYDKAATLLAAFEISRRIGYQTKFQFDQKITSPGEVAGIFIPMLRDELKEHFIVVCLSSANRILRYEIISTGSLNASIVHAREVFKVAIENSSANIILLHNHPSGNPEPSIEDIAVTKRLVEAGKILDIQVFDHLIIAGNSFTSFVERRLI